MAFEFDFNAEDLNFVDERIRNFLRSAMDKIGHTLVEKTKSAFKAGVEGARDGHDAWETTTEIARYNRKVGSPEDPTLTDSRELQEGIEYEVTESENEFLLVYGSSAGYAKDVQKGSILSIEGGNFNVPAREFLVIMPSDEEDIESIFGQEKL